MSNDFKVEDSLQPTFLLERFLSDCEALCNEIEGDAYSFTYVADTIAAVYYHREYDSAEQFIQENQDFIDDERAEWVQYMWRTLDSMTEEQKSNIVIESIGQMQTVQEV